MRDSPVPVTVQILIEDPPHHRGRRILDREHPKPVALRRLSRVRVRARVDDHVAIRRPTALITPLVHDLGIHRSPDPDLRVLALRLAHPAQHTHQHLVRRVQRIEPLAQLRDPQVNPVCRELRSNQRELIPEPATRALAHDHAVPRPIRILQRSEKPPPFHPSLPGHGPRLTDVEEDFGDVTAQWLDELPRVSHLPGARRLGILIVLRGAPAVDSKITDTQPGVSGTRIEKRSAVTAAQLRAVIECLTVVGHWQPGDPQILVVYDAGYDITQLAYLSPTFPSSWSAASAPTGSCGFDWTRPKIRTPAAADRWTCLMDRRAHPAPGSASSRP
jgi:hypothetical protein